MRIHQSPLRPSAYTPRMAQKTVVIYTDDLTGAESEEANARHHNPGYTMRAYGRRRADSAKKLATASADRIGLSTVAA